MCTMLNIHDREEVLKAAEELAMHKIYQLKKDVDAEDGEMDGDQVDELMDAVCILKKAACTRKIHYEIEDMMVERMEMWKTNGCPVPSVTAATGHAVTHPHNATGVTPPIPAVVSRS